MIRTLAAHGHSLHVPEDVALLTDLQLRNVTGLSRRSEEAVGNVKKVAVNDRIDTDATILYPELHRKVWHTPSILKLVRSVLGSDGNIKPTIAQRREELLVRLQVLTLPVVAQVLSKE